ncbi:hypothetical protein BXO88_05635 [Oribacterium sp. C9]|uniref:DUF3810 domain-containing protein n=1 Tax=Oribacterium sp. C9 TaxID=1943579 RepID=UPI00098EE569|nr:DUF3810 domain-containing protein [Oribacterium sp. C9]OON87021.1 hypothetical protein BXO88_05635 [Oribacterium sp. C9]
MNLKVFIRKYKLYFIALIFDLMALTASCLAAGTPFFANVYSHTIYRFGSLLISRITGLLPFSLVEILLYALLVFIPVDLVFQIVSGIRRLTVFIGHLFLILSLLFTLYVFNCGINYRRASFSAEAGLSSVSPDLNEETLTKLCEYLVDNINRSESALYSGNDSAALSVSNVSGEVSPEHTSSDTTVLPVRLYNGAVLGENRFSKKPSLPYLWNTGKAGQAAMEKIGAKFPRLSGHYPFPKPLINSWILSIQQVTGVYSPFTIEANYNRDIPYYDIPFTVCHELSHLRGYMQEEEANFIAILATIGSEDAYFNYSGYVSAWVYAGNALAKADPEKFVELYSRINSYTRQDMQYNNEFWDRYETKIAETQEKLNDAYLKYNGQSTGVLSYGHVVDLMVVYYNENGTLGY